MKVSSLRQRLQDGRPLLLDGPTGTELTRRGISTDLPLWSAGALLTAPEVVSAIHLDYVSCGAEIITTNTFRTHRRTLARAGLADRTCELTQLATLLARSAAGERAWVAGSMSPLEDCYRPDLTPPEADLVREHAQMAENLFASGVDLLLVETQPTSREAMAAARAAFETGLPVMVSFVCGGDGNLLSGEPLEEAVRRILPLSPIAVLVNCLPVDAAEVALLRMRDVAGDTPFGAYANVGYADPQQGWVNTDSVDPAVYAVHARAWLTLGARLIGGCCGTTPGHIRALRRVIDDEFTTSCSAPA